MNLLLYVQSLNLFLYGGEAGAPWPRRPGCRRPGARAPVKHTVAPRRPGESRAAGAPEAAGATRRAGALGPSHDPVRASAQNNT